MHLISPSTSKKSKRVSHDRQVSADICSEMETDE